ncbi:MAG: succinyl-diaminopimelate desuccinylase [Pseudomonadota bacterium]
MSEQTPVTALLYDLLSRQSVTPDDAGCQDVMIARLEALGFRIERLPFSDEKGQVHNFWARKGEATPCFAFAGHTDVVPTGPVEAWSAPPFEPTIKDGHIYARGAADMKTSLAAAIVATEDFIDANPDHAGSIGFLITSDEEGPATCGTVKVVEHLINKGEHIDYCLVGEPSSSDILGDVIKNGRRGSIGCNLTIKGKQGHIAYPHLAINPIHLAAEAICAIKAIEWDKGNEYFPPTSLQFSNLNSGTGATNVIPGHADLMFNLRFSTETSSDEIMHRIEQLLADLKIDYEADWRVFGQPFLTERGALVNACLAATNEVCGLDTELSTSGGTSDGRFIAPMGTEVVELGPVNRTIHQVDECVAVEAPEKLKAVYEAVLRNILV